MNQPSKFTEAEKLLSACQWSVLRITSITGVKQRHEVYDNAGILVRVFVPEQRLLDYAHGVFDATEF